MLISKVNFYGREILIVLGKYGQNCRCKGKKTDQYIRSDPLLW